MDRFTLLFGAFAILFILFKLVVRKIKENKKDCD
jgi:hypothetical protein